jgi:hypothetical protein
LRQLVHPARAAQEVHIARSVVSFTLFALLATARASAAGQQAAPTTAVDASGGGVTIASGDNSLTIGARVQFRWTVDDFEQLDSDLAGLGVGTPDGTLSRFDIPRARVNLSGGVYKPWLKYSLQIDLVTGKMKDALIEWRPVGKTYSLFAGQVKAPFSFQQMISSARQQFVDRAITDLKFAPSRDRGVLFAGTNRHRTLGLQGGVFNGAGEGASQPWQTPLWVARVYVDPLGPYSLAEGSVDAVDKPQLHVGLGVRTGSPIRGRATPGIVQHVDDETAADVELAYKTRRYSATADYYRMNDQQQNPVALPDLKSMGFHAQVGAMLVPHRVEVGVRFADVEGDTSVDDSAVSEVRGVFGYFWRGHNLKLQSDVGRLHYGAAFNRLSARALAGLPPTGHRLTTGQPLSDIELRLQLQLLF